MKHSRIATLLLIVVPAVVSAQQMRAPTLSEMVATLRVIADNYPPTVANEQERRDAVALYHRIESGLNQYVTAHETLDFNAELLLGDVERMGHNLGVEGAGKNAITHLQKAIAIEPANPQGHHVLGQHLTTMNMTTEALPHLLLAYTLEKDDEREATTYFLAQNFYMQKQYAIALVFADRYAARKPYDRAIAMIREAAQREIKLRQ